MALSLDQANLLQQTTWGSRAGADNDDSYRMIGLPQYGDSSSAMHPQQDHLKLSESTTEEHYPLLPVYSADN
jgi:hypothetical protein